MYSPFSWSLTHFIWISDVYIDIFILIYWLILFGLQVSFCWLLRFIRAHSFPCLYLFDRLWALPLKLISICLILSIFLNLMALTITLGLLAWSLLFNHVFYGFMPMVKKICLRLSNLLSLQLIKHQRIIRVGKRIENSTKLSCKWIVLP